jgi:hypothetical protein
LNLEVIYIEDMMVLLQSQSRGYGSVLLLLLLLLQGKPRLKPPFPAGVGLYGCPTTGEAAAAVYLWSITVYHYY